MAPARHAYCPAHRRLCSAHPPRIPVPPPHCSRHKVQFYDGSRASFSMQEDAFQLLPGSPAAAGPVLPPAPPAATAAAGAAPGLATRRGGGGDVQPPRPPKPPVGPPVLPGDALPVFRERLQQGFVLPACTQAFTLDRILRVLRLHLARLKARMGWGAEGQRAGWRQAWGGRRGSAHAHARALCCPAAALQGGARGRGLDGTCQGARPWGRRQVCSTQQYGVVPRSACTCRPPSFSQDFPGQWVPKSFVRQYLHTAGVRCEGGRARGRGPGASGGGAQQCGTLRWWFANTWHARQHLHAAGARREGGTA